MGIAARPECDFVKLENPPWRLGFRFTREIGERAEHAMGLIGPEFRDISLFRERLRRNLCVKLSDWRKYYPIPSAAGVVSLACQELFEPVNMTSGTFVFDVKAETWVRIATNSGVWMPFEVLKDAFRNAGLEDNEQEGTPKSEPQDPTSEPHA